MPPFAGNVFRILSGLMSRPGGGLLLEILGGGVPPGSQTPDPISDQKMSFSTPVFRPGARFSKVPIINGPIELLLFTWKMEVSIVLQLT